MKINGKKSLLLFIIFIVIFSININVVNAATNNFNTNNTISIKNTNSDIAKKTSSSSKKGNKSSSTKSTKESSDENKETHTVNSKDKTISNYQNTLKSLSIDDYDIYPEFNKNTVEYYVSIPKSISNLYVNAVAEYSDATVKIIGNTNLNDRSENLIKVVVTSSKNVSKTYTIHVNRIESNGLYLSSLNIEGVNLNPVFDKDTYYYTAEVEENEIKPFEINAIANQANANVEIIGNDESLVKGDNLISIILSNGKDTSVYQIEITINEKKMITINNNSSNKFLDVIEKCKDFIFKSKESFFTFIAIIFLLILILLILIIKKIKTNKKDKKRQELKKRVN